MTAFALFFSIGFVEKKYQAKTCNRVYIEIVDQQAHFFLDEQDIHMMLSDGGKQKLLGRPYAKSPLREMEQRLVENAFLERAEIAKDLSGAIRVRAKQSRPIARMVQSDKPHAYVSDRAEVLPMSTKFTARVPVVSGEVNLVLNKDQIIDDSENDFYRLMRYIDEDDFWRSQISGVHILPSGEIEFLTQVSKQRVEFGKPQEIEEKFKKLHIFYKEILPAKGWNEYSRVNLKYRNQIICE